MKLAPILGLRSLFRERTLPSRRVLVINGNPDSGPERYSAALADAYAAGSRASGCLVRRLDVGRADTAEDSLVGSNDALLADREIAHMLERIFWADRVFVVYPIWLGAPPDRLQALFNAFAKKSAYLKAQFPMVQFSGEKPARLVATASFPTFFYRPSNQQSDLSSQARAATTLAGIHVVDSTLIGSVDSISPKDRFHWLKEMHRRGQTDRGAFSRPAFDTIKGGP